MSDVFGIAQTAEVALAAATAKTVIQVLAAANHRTKILGWGIYFDGVSATAAPVEVVLNKQTTAGTMTALTPVKSRPATETLQTTSQHTASVEPTAGDILDMIECHPQQGYEVKFPQGQEIVLAGGERLGIVVTAPAVVNCRAKFIFEE